ncbi:MAG: glycosyltransferase [Anaerolineae bacterium]|nr:glycosyltransferase [Anaerolineae bacterium]
MQKKLKVAYVLGRFPYLTETFILREMLLLRRSGLEVHVFSVFPPLPTPVHEEVQEMMPYVHYSPYLLSIQLVLAHLYFLLHNPLRYVSAFFMAVWQTYREPLILLRVLLVFPKAVYFAKQIKDLNIDHIHAHFVWVNGIVAKVASDLTGTTFSLHPHAFDLFMRDRESLRRQFELADGVVTVSEYHRRYIADICPSWSPEQIQIVHYGVDPAEFTPKHLPAEGDVTRIISVGSLYEKKGHIYLIDACAELARQGYKFCCYIVGGGAQAKFQERIESHGLKDCVLLLGPKKQVEIRHLYSQSDIFVLACVVAKSGDRDGMPNVLLEAMAMQIPVVSTPVTGIPELVQDGETGLLVPERDAVALAQAIGRLIDDKKLRDRLGRQGRQAVLAGFDIHQTSAQLAAAFQDFYNSNGKQ